MSTPLGRSNIVGGLLDNVNDAGLTGLAAVLGNAVTISGSTIATPTPQSLILLCALVSGGLTINVSAFAVGGSPNFGSPTKTLNVTTTAPQYIHLDMTAAAPNFAIQVVSGASGCQISELGFLSLNQLHQGQGWFDVTSGQNAVASAYTGQGQLPGPAFTLGSGVLSIGPISNNVFTP